MAPVVCYHGKPRCGFCGVDGRRSPQRGRRKRLCAVCGRRSARLTGDRCQRCRGRGWRADAAVEGGVTVTREDRARAVRLAIMSSPATDALVPLLWRRSVAQGDPLPLPVRWHYRLRPWLYPDWPAFPRHMRVIGWRRT